MRSSALFWVVIRPKHRTTWVGCQPEPAGRKSVRIGPVRANRFSRGNLFVPAGGPSFAISRSKKKARRDGRAVGWTLVILIRNLSESADLRDPADSVRRAGAGPSPQ